MLQPPVAPTCIYAEAASVAKQVEYPLAVCQSPYPLPVVALVQEEARLLALHQVSLEVHAVLIEHHRRLGLLA